MTSDLDHRLGTAEARVATAEAALKAALLAGAGTAAARAALDDAIAERRKAEAAREAGLEAAARQEAEAIDARAEALFEGCMAHLAAKFGAFNLPAPPAGLQIGA